MPNVEEVASLRVSITGATEAQIQRLEEQINALEEQMLKRSQRKEILPLAPTGPSAWIAPGLPIGYFTISQAAVTSWATAGALMHSISTAPLSPGLRPSPATWFSILAIPMLAS